MALLSAFLHVVLDELFGIFFQNCVDRIEEVIDVFERFPGFRLIFNREFFNFRRCRRLGLFANLLLRHSRDIGKKV